MINLSIELCCDGCEKKADVRIANAAVFPTGQFLLAAFGFQQFLCGPILCEECAQNQEALDRVQRIHTRLVSEAIAKNTPPIEAGRENGHPAPPPANGEINTKTHRRISTEEMQECISRHGGNVALTARELGCSTAAIYLRIKSGNIFQYSNPNRSVVPVGTVAA